jgi:hypothetical protein
LAPFHNGPTTLSPQELSVKDHLPRKVLIVGHCSAESWGFHQYNLTKTPCDFILVNNLQNLPKQSPEELAAFDFQVINFPLRFVLNDHLLWGAVAKSEAELQVIFDRSVKSLESLFKLYTEYNEQTGMLTFVTNFMVSSFNPRGKLAPYYSLNNPQFFIDSLNKEIERLSLSRKNTYVINLDVFARFNSACLPSSSQTIALFVMSVNLPPATSYWTSADRAFFIDKVKKGYINIDDTTIRDRSDSEDYF